MIKDRATAIEALRQAQQALNDALRDAALAQIHTDLEVFQGYSFPKILVKVKGWTRDDLL